MGRPDPQPGALRPACRRLRRLHGGLVPHRAEPPGGVHRALHVYLCRVGGAARGGGRAQRRAGPRRLYQYAGGGYAAHPAGGFHFDRGSAQALGTRTGERRCARIPKSEAPAARATQRATHSNTRAPAHTATGRRRAIALPHHFAPPTRGTSDYKTGLHLHVAVRSPDPADPPRGTATLRPGVTGRRGHLSLYATGGLSLPASCATPTPVLRRGDHGRPLDRRILDAMDRST